MTAGRLRQRRTTCLWCEAMTAAALTGRDGDLDVVRMFLDDASVSGAALLLTGEPGVGKTALLDAAHGAATAARARVLRAAGVEFEADVSFSGLNQVLLPLGEELAELSATYRDALKVALGLIAGPPSDRLVISNAALALLRQAAEAGPLLVILDDLPWLDRASALVLGFVARRLDGSRVGFLAAARTGAETCFDRGGLPAHEVRPLDSVAAADLISASFPDLAPAVSQRVLAEAQGNPLALLELPLALNGAQRRALAALPPILPLSGRLQALFTSRASDLPAPTRYLLLLAALEGSGDLAVLQAAAAGQREIDDLAPAEQAGLVYVQEDTGRLAFRHPLIRSAVYYGAPFARRQQVHACLARAAGPAEPDQRAWHLAHAVTGPDEKVAAELERAGERACRGAAGARRPRCSTARPR